MFQIKQSTVQNAPPFFAHDANGDAVTGKVDGNFTKRISKNGGAFAAMTVTITERENGWYHYQLSAAHTDTQGPLTVTFTASGIKQVNNQFLVRARTVDDIATPQVVLGAVVATRDPGNRTASPIALEMFQNEEKTFSLTVQDSAGAAVDLSGLTLRFVVQDSNNTAKFKVESPNLTVSGDSNEVANVKVTSTQSATATTEYHWRLWDVGNETVLLYGSFKIKPAQPDYSP